MGSWIQQTIGFDCSQDALLLALCGVVAQQAQPWKRKGLQSEQEFLPLNVIAA